MFQSITIWANDASGCHVTLSERDLVDAIRHSQRRHDEAFNASLRASLSYDDKGLVN